MLMEIIRLNVQNLIQHYKTMMYLSSNDIEGPKFPYKRGKENGEKWKPDLGICAYHYPEQVADVLV